MTILLGRVSERSEKTSTSPGCLLMRSGSKQELCSHARQLPPLCPPVLEPRLDLGIRHFEVLGEGGALGRGKVFLLVEALLQLADLDTGE